MKFNTVAIVGYKHGIGKELHTHYLSTEKIIEVYDTEYNFDNTFIETLIETSKKIEVFINNLPLGELQLVITKKWFEANQDRQAIMIILNSIDYHDYLDTNPTPEIQQYTKNKLNLSCEVFEMVKLRKKCKLLIVAPGPALADKDNSELKKKLRGPNTLINKTEIISLIDWAVESYEQE